MKRLLLFLMIAGAAIGQNAVMLPWVPQQFTNTNGTVLVSGKVCTYLAGTSTGTATFTDATASVQNAIPPNAILLDSTGRPTSGGIWLTPNKAYKIVTMTAGSDSTCNTGVVIKTQDQVQAQNASFSVPITPTTAGGQDLGTTALPWGNLWLGTAATNNFRFQPAVIAAPRIVTVPDPGANDSLTYLAATQTLTNKTINVPLNNGTAIEMFNTSTTCTTGASVGATCTTANITLPVTQPDTSYRMWCTGRGFASGVPVFLSATNVSTSQFTISIAALTAVAASFSSFDCLAAHN